MRTLDKLLRIGESYADVQRYKGYVDRNWNLLDWLAFTLLGGSGILDTERFRKEVPILRAITIVTADIAGNLNQAAEIRGARKGGKTKDPTQLRSTEEFAALDKETQEETVETSSKNIMEKLLKDEGVNLDG